MNKIFAKLQQIIWPIKKEENKLFIPLALMMLCLLFNFGALRSIKDGLIVPTIGAEAISFLKLWLVLPSSIIFTLFYVYLSNRFSSENIFYIVITIFLGFFLVFTFVIYPYQHSFHPSAQIIAELSNLYPNLQWFIKIFGKWSYALMYIFAELWSAVVINLMFWQFANHIFDTEEAKRFYPILGMVGNLGLVFAGNVLTFYSVFYDRLDSTDYIDNVEMSHIYISNMLKPVMSIIISLGIIATLLFRFVNKVALRSRSLYHVDPNIRDVRDKLTIGQSIRLIIHSKYIGHIVLLIVCYGLLINIVESSWKARITEIYPNTIDYVNFMGKFNIWMGISCVAFMIIGSNILRNFSWLKSALLTPIMMAITGILFFAFVIFGKKLGILEYGFDPIYLAVFIGSIQNILSKATKYSLFDSTKEMAYIPLSKELKTKGKAAVEIIGIKFGKSLGAFIQSTIFIITPQATFDSIAIYLVSIFIVVICIWFWNVVKLNQEYLKFFNKS